MKSFLERLRLYWWRRAYKKIWNGSHFKESPTFSTKTEDEADDLASFIYGNIVSEKPRTVLDVGCGNGALGQKVFRDASLLVQTDYSLNALRATKQTGASSLKRVQSDGGRLPFKESVFDCIFLYSVIHNSGTLENAQTWIRNMLPLLKDNGFIYLGDVPLRRKIRPILRQKLAKARTLNDIKYFFAEFMQNSFSIDDFADFDDVSQVVIIRQPPYIRFSAWRVDIMLKKSGQNALR